MAEGFEVYSESGFLQIDNKSPTMTFAFKGTAYTGIAITYSSVSSLRIDVPAWVIAPVVAIRCTQPTCHLYTVNNGDGSKTYWYVSNCGFSTAIDYYVFDSIINYSPISSNAGLELYNSTGQVTFSTARGIAELHAYISATPSNTALTLGRQYAIVCGSFSGYRVQTVNGDPDDPSTGTGGIGSYPRIQDSQAWGVYIASQFAGVDKCQFASGPSGIAPDYNTPFHGALVLDVTQYGGGAVNGTGAGSSLPSPVPPPTIYSVRMTPGDQLLSGPGSSRTFGQSVGTKRDGEPTNADSYYWEIIGNDGNWVFNTGTNGANAIVQVNNVPLGDEASVILQCSLSVDGQAFTLSANLRYFRG